MIIGPPRTGKSQTIANMIPNCLASGKTVLFVAEKTAALNVHRRLKAHGLGDHCLELYSNKGDRKSFLAQLRNSWGKGRTAASIVLQAQGDFAPLGPIQSGQIACVELDPPVTEDDAVAWHKTIDCPELGPQKSRRRHHRQQATS